MRIKKQLNNLFAISFFLQQFAVPLTSLAEPVGVELPVADTGSAYYQPVAIKPKSSFNFLSLLPLIQIFLQQPDDYLFCATGGGGGVVDGGGGGVVPGGGGPPVEPPCSS
jgi:hypothetical protein